MSRGGGNGIKGEKRGGRFRTLSHNNILRSPQSECIEWFCRPRFKGPVFVRRMGLEKAPFQPRPPSPSHRIKAEAEAVLERERKESLPPHDSHQRLISFTAAGGSQTTHSQRIIVARLDGPFAWHSTPAALCGTWG